MVLKISLAAAVVTALLGAFLVVRTSDEAIVRGATAVITVWEIGEELTRDQVQEEIAETAAKNDMTLYRSIDSVTPAGQAVRTLTVIHAGTKNALPQSSDPYPDFGRSVKTRFAPIAPGSSPGGMYVTSANSSTAEKLVTTLRDQGVSVSLKEVNPAALILFTAEVVPLFPLVLAAILALTIGCIHAAVGFRRQDAIRQVNGATTSRLLLGHAGRSAILTLLFGAIGLALSVPVLAVYNGLAQFWLFAAIGGLSVAAIAVTAAALVLLSAGVASKRRPLAVISGRRPLRRLAAFGGTAHTLALALVLVVVAYVTASGLPALQNKADSASWIPAQKFTYLTFRTSSSELDRDAAAFAEIGRRLLQHPRDGLIVRSPEGDTEGHGPEIGNSLIVNTRYLAEQPILNRSGHQIKAVDVRPEALTLLIPEGTPGSIPELVDEYQEWIFFQAELRGGAPHPEEIPIDYQVIPGAQSLFNYATQATTSRQLAPVVAILPSRNPLLSDDWISSGMTHGVLLFSDTEWLRAELRESGVESSVVLNRVSDLAALRLADQERLLRASSFAGLLATLVAILSATLLAVSIAERNRRRDFVRHIHGTGTLRITLAPILAIAASNGLILSLASSAQLFESTLALEIAATVAVADLLVFGALLAFQRRRFRADTIKNS